MKPERWQEIERLFNAAAKLSPAEREDFLAAACRGDESLRSEVSSLLACRTEADGFMNSPAIGPAPDADH